MEDYTTLLFDPVAAAQSSVTMAMRSILEFTTGRCIQKAAGLSSETAGGQTLRGAPAAGGGMAGGHRLFLEDKTALG